MAILPHRIVIYTKDVSNITGLKPRTAQKLLYRIRRSLNKEEGSLVTVHDFCRYTGIKEEHVIPFLK
jgi:hypothetical protein